MKNIKMLLLFFIAVVGCANASDRTVIRHKKQNNQEQTKESKEKVAALRQYFEESVKRCDTGQWPEDPSSRDPQLTTASELCQVLGANAEAKTPILLAFKKSKSGYLCDLSFMSDDYCDNCYRLGKALSYSSYRAHQCEQYGKGDAQFKCYSGGRCVPVAPIRLGNVSIEASR